MKKIYLLVIAFVVTASVLAQARNTTAQYQGSKQPAIEFDVPFPEKTVNKSIDNYFENKGYKGKDASGYLTYKGVRLPELGPDYYDLYFKTDKKSRKEKDATTVTMLISAGYSKFIGDTTWETAYDCIQTSDSGFVIVGIKGKYSPSLNGDYWIVKTDINGNVTWERTIGSSLDEQAFRVVENNKNQIVVSGAKEIANPIHFPYIVIL